MASHFKSNSLPLRAPQILGALFLLVATLLTACKDDQATPTWKEPKQEPTPNATPVTTPPVAPEPEPAPEPTPTPQPEPTPEPAPSPTETTDPAKTADVPVEPAPEPAPEPDRLRFVSYNLKNYLRMARFKNGEKVGEADKPSKEKESIVRLIAAAKPDVLGVCEIGQPVDLQDLQVRLKEAGVDLPHSRHAGGMDEVRHLGILSRYPILPAGPAPKLDYKLMGKDMVMSRGILDAVIDVQGHHFHFLGAHLKSKREIPEADQELMRRNEAYLLRKHADRIFAENPDACVVVYGDFNDTRRTTAVRSIQGAYNSPRYLEAVHHTDSRGEVWTHFWEYQHIYSRFDYVMVSKPLRKAIDDQSCRLLDDALWATASDHRALLTVFELDELPAPVRDEPEPVPVEEEEAAPEPEPVAVP